MLTAIGGTGAVGLTGCLSDQRGDGRGEDEGFAAEISFPVVQEFAEKVVPEGSEANSLVPTGQHGHGWKPSPDVQRSVISADAFVYVFEGFQPWADDMVTNIQRDHPDIATVEAGEGIDMLSIDYSLNEGHDGGETHEGEHTGEHGHEEEDGHDHGDVNPHFWLDPLRAKTAVENVADGLSAADDSEGYTQNAQEYKSALDDLHAEFEMTLSDASKNAVLVAGHDAFTYLGARYRFRVETLTGVAPDEQPSPRDIQRAQEMIDEEGIEYVLSPVFESDTAAESLVSDTTATEVLPITAFAGFSQDWLDRGWGYAEVMRNVNLSSLEKALDA
jgi:zinc transport system substrate-binding protein